MRNQQYYGYAPANDISPLRENYLLKVDDIPGAKPRQGHATKNTDHYYHKIAAPNDVFEANRQMHEQLYAMGNYHQGYNPYSSQKKHYGIHQESEISRTGVMIRRDDPDHLKHIEFPRNLTTQDIPGAIPGSLQSKTVKNHDLAHRIRGSSTGPASVPRTTDTLDKFQEAYRSSAPARDPTLIPPGTNNFHYLQHQTKYGQPRASSSDQYYSTPTPILTPPPQHQQQKDYRNSVNPNEQSFVQERKAKHVMFKEERREEPSQYDEQPNQEKEQPSQYIEEQTPYREQPSQYKDQPAPLREQPRRYAEQPSHYRQSSEGRQQDYLDSYVSQTAESSQPNSAITPDVNMQDYSSSSPLKPTNNLPYSINRDKPAQPNKDISQQAIEHKIRETIRGRVYNIISNGPLEHIRFENGRRAYGSALKSMVKNQEDLRQYYPNASRVWTPSGQLNSSMTQGDRSGVEQKSTNGPHPGEANSYIEPGYRPSNRPSQLPPLAQVQYYGSRAIKNLNSMGYY